MALTGKAYQSMRMKFRGYLSNPYWFVSESELDNFIGQLAIDVTGSVTTAQRNQADDALARALTSPDYTAVAADVATFFAQLAAAAPLIISALTAQRYQQLKSALVAGLSVAGVRTEAQMLGYMSNFFLINFASFFTTANIIHSHQSDIGVTTATGVSSWNDPTRSVAFAQATGSKQPALTAGLNAFSGLLFDGVDDTLDNSTVNLPLAGVAGTWHGFVFRQVSYSGSQAQMFGGLSSATHILYESGVSPNCQLFNGSGGPPVNNGAPVGTWVCGEYYIENTTNDYMRFGSVVTAGTAAGGTGTTGLQIGNANNTAGRYKNLELLASTRITGLPSGAQIAAWRAGVTAKYGATVSV